MHGAQGHRRRIRGGHQAAERAQAGKARFDLGRNHGSQHRVNAVRADHDVGMHRRLAPAAIGEHELGGIRRIAR